MKVRNIILICSIVLTNLFFVNCTNSNLEAVSNDLISTPSPEPTPPDTEEPTKTSSFLPGFTAAIPYKYDQIEEHVDFLTVDKSKTGYVSIAGDKYQYNYFRNKSYKCGKDGYYTFLAVQKDSLDIEAPIWTYLHGGGSSFCYFNETTGKNECTNEKQMMEFSADELFKYIQSNTTKSTGYKSTIMANRLREGQRIVALTMCDHDYYAGLSTPFPNNPYWNNEPQTVDGLTASIAAVNYIFTKYPNNGQLFLHGTSAGSGGAYHLSMGLLNNGIKSWGVILDAGMNLHNDKILGDTQCTPHAQNAIELGMSFDTYNTYLAQKIGIFAQMPELGLEANYAKNGIPYFAIVGSKDQYCCGEYPPVAEAVAAGFSNNCYWKMDTFRTLLETSNQKSLNRYRTVEGGGHVVSGSEEFLGDASHQVELEAWYQDVMNSHPAPVKFQ